MENKTHKLEKNMQQFMEYLHTADQGEGDDRKKIRCSFRVAVWFKNS